MRLKSGTIDIVNGPLYRSIVRYTIPIMLAGVIANLFHSADLIVLGQMASVSAVSAVGVTGTPVALIVNTLIGLGTGVTIQLSRAVGANDHERIRRIVNTSMITAAAIGVLMAVLGVTLCRPILQLVACPESLMADASMYMTIYFSAAPAILIYNFGASILRVYGDTKRPLYYLVASGALNIVLNVVLCLVLERKVAAVAIATFSSQVIGAALVMIRLCRGERGDMHLSLRHLSFDFGVFRRVLILGVPSAVSSAMYAIGSLPMNRAINGFGEAAIAGNSASINVENLLSAIAISFNTTIVTFMGQNIGAGKQERVNKSLLYSALSGVVLSLAFGILVPLLAEWVLSIYVPDAEAIAYGAKRIDYIVRFMFITSLLNSASAALQAFGKTALTTANNLFFTLVFRFFWVYAVFPHFNTLSNVYLGFVVSWVLNLILVGIFLFFTMRRYNRGEMKNM